MPMLRMLTAVFCFCRRRQETWTEKVRDLKKEREKAERALQNFGEIFGEAFEMTPVTQPQPKNTAEKDEVPKDDETTSSVRPHTAASSGAKRSSSSASSSEDPRPSSAPQCQKESLSSEDLPGLVC